MSAAYHALVAEADRWLEQAIGTYRGGGDYTVTAAEAAIASAHYARALLEKPDAFGQLVAASAAQRAQAGQQAQAAAIAEATQKRAEAASKARHPAGRKRPAAQPKETS